MGADGTPFRGHHLSEFAGRLKWLTPNRRANPFSIVGSDSGADANDVSHVFWRKASNSSASGTPPTIVQAA